MARRNKLLIKGLLHSASEYLVAGEAAPAHLGKGFVPDEMFAWLRSAAASSWGGMGHGDLRTLRP